MPVAKYYNSNRCRVTVQSWSCIPRFTSQILCFLAPWPWTSYLLLLNPLICKMRDNNRPTSLNCYENWMSTVPGTKLVKKKYMCLCFLYLCIYFLNYLFIIRSYYMEWNTRKSAGGSIFKCHLLKTNLLVFISFPWVQRNVSSIWILNIPLPN